VDKHNNKGLFRIRPDILVESDTDNPHYDCIIIDTKWKAIDSTKPDKHYLLDIKDMYQLYAYGQKYKLGEENARNVDVIPKLVLLYPYTEHFTKELPVFVYDDIDGDIGLKLLVFPFNLSAPATYSKQIVDIIDKVKTPAS
jgi:5-methylcytosine-specific restriction enzyme subunit McrC